MVLKEQLALRCCIGNPFEAAAPSQCTVPLSDTTSHAPALSASNTTDAPSLARVKARPAALPLIASPVAACRSSANGLARMKEKLSPGAAGGRWIVALPEQPLFEKTVPESLRGWTTCVPVATLTTGCRSPRHWIPPVPTTNCT